MDIYLIQLTVFLNLFYVFVVSALFMLSFKTTDILFANQVINQTDVTYLSSTGWGRFDL